MLNNVVLVGRVAIEPELNVYDNGLHSTRVILAIQKPFRNEQNEYETDFIPVVAWNKTAEVICDYVGKGSILGCKCRLSTHKVELDDVKMNVIDVIAERIAFISTKPRSQKAKQEREDEMIDRELRKNNFFDDLDPIDINKGEKAPFFEDFPTEVVDESEKEMDDEIGGEKKASSSKRKK